MTFSIWYAFFENFVLPLSHDEVVHGKGSLIGKMPGDTWQQFANLRLLFGYMWGHPGKKLLFMGGEFGQRREWTHDGALEWWVLRHGEHAGVQRWVADLNALYRREPALHEVDFNPAGFEWVDCHDSEASVFSFLRHPRHGTACSRRLQFHAGSAHQLHGRRTGGRLLARAAEQRCRALRRQRHRQSGRRRGRAGAVARPVPLACADGAAARGRVPEARPALAALADAAPKARARAA